VPVESPEGMYRLVLRGRNGRRSRGTPSSSSRSTCAVARSCGCSRFRWL